jgi:hypothetical protein
MAEAARAPHREVAPVLSSNRDPPARVEVRAALLVLDRENTEGNRACLLGVVSIN